MTDRPPPSLGLGGGTGVRCYLYRAGHIVAVEVLAAGSDDALILQARAAFETRKHEFDGFEVWDRARFIYRFPEPLPDSIGAGIISRPPFYRVCLLGEGGVLGQYHFPANSDGDALQVARLVFEACSDRAKRFELWHGLRLIGSEEQQAAMAALEREQVVAKQQAHVVELEEHIRDSKDAVASSKRLLSRLEALKPLSAEQGATETADSSAGTTSGSHDEHP